MLTHTRGHRLNLICKLWQRRIIPFRQFPDAACEGLGNAIQFALHGALQGG